MGLWENFALGFTYLSPVVGICSVSALGFVAGGPPMIWSIVIAGPRPVAGRARVRGDRRPIPGCGRDLPVGTAADRPPLGVVTGWIYGWALIATIASVSTGAVIFVGSLFSFTPSRFVTVLIAFGPDAAVPGDQPQRHSDPRPVRDGRIRRGTHPRACSSAPGCCCSNATTTSACSSTRSGPKATAATSARSWPPALLGLYLFYGFEACGDVAEEVPDPGLDDPEGDAAHDLHRRRGGDTLSPRR